MGFNEAMAARPREPVSDAPVEGQAEPQLEWRAERVMEICEAMIDICAALFDVPSKALRSTKRTTAGVSRVRQIGMYVTHVTLHVSMQEVGRGFARDRTTVRHACHLIEDLRDDPEIDRAVCMTEAVARAAFGHRLEG